MQIPNVIGNYAIGEKIGEGNYAEVKLATHCLLKQKVCLVFKKVVILQTDLLRNRICVTFINCEPSLVSETNKS